MQRSTMPSPSSGAETIFEHLPVGVALFEAHSLRLVMANASYQDLLDQTWQQGRAIGHPLTDFFPQAESSGVTALFRQVAATGHPLHQDLSASWATDGSTAYWNWTLSPITDQTGQVVQVLLT